MKGTKGYAKVPWHYLFELFFNVECIDQFPRQYFLPWERTKTTKKQVKVFPSSFFSFQS